MSLVEFESWIVQKIADFQVESKVGTNSVSDMCKQDYAKHVTYSGADSFRKSLYERYNYAPPST